MDMMIYGAQGYALGAYNAIKVLYPERRVLFFAVTSMEENPEELGGLPVRQIADAAEGMSEKEKGRIRVLIATPENVQDVIEETLEQYGYSDRIRLTSELWDKLMRRMNEQTGRFAPLAQMKAGKMMPAIRIFVARSHVDKPLKTSYAMTEYMIPIQVGAANTTSRIADIRDDEGDNISSKNGNYCELTGLYWMWKNRLRDLDDERCYYGFAQYRRMLILSDEDLLRLSDNDVDAVLPYPLMYEPDMNAHHDRYIKEKDWEALLKAVSEVHPDHHLSLFQETLKQQFMYNYNVILAKGKVLRKYCDWLFPILERVEEISVPKGSERSDRYIGYMAETLETVYFMTNKDRLKIAHAGCRLLV